MHLIVHINDDFLSFSLSKSHWLEIRERMREIVSLEGFWDFWGPKANNTLNFTWFIQHNTGVCMEGVGTGMGMGMWDGENRAVIYV